MIILCYVNHSHCSSPDQLRAKQKKNTKKENKLAALIQVERDKMQFLAFTDDDALDRFVFVIGDFMSLRAQFGRRWIRVFSEWINVSTANARTSAVETHSCNITNTYICSTLPPKSFLPAKFFIDLSTFVSFQTNRTSVNTRTKPTHFRPCTELVDGKVVCASLNLNWTRKIQ